MDVYSLYLLYLLYPLYLLYLLYLSTYLTLGDIRTGCVF